MWLQVVVLWLHSPAAEEIISLFDVFVESHGRVVFLFAGQTLPTSSRRSCRGCLLDVAVGVMVPKKPRGDRAVGTPSSEGVFDVR